MSKIIYKLKEDPELRNAQIRTARFHYGKLSNIEKAKIKEESNQITIEIENNADSVEVID